MKPLYKLLLIALAVVIIAHFLWDIALNRIEFVETTKGAGETPKQVERTDELMKQIESDHPDMTKEEIKEAANRIRVAEEVLANRKAHEQTQQLDPVDDDQ